MEQSIKSKSGGYALIAVIILLVASLIAVQGTLSLAASDARTTYAIKLRAQDYYNAEQAIGHAAQWLRINSQRLVSPFSRKEFYTRFRRTDPSYGSNDVAQHRVLTKIKLAGSSDSAILTNSSGLATAAFPQTTDIVDNTVFPAQGSFSAVNFGNTLIRVTLVDALPGVPAKDYGAPPNAAPETDFYPIYQIDAMTATDSGAYVYASVTTQITHQFNYGIHGEDYLELRQDCDSYISADGVYTEGSKLPNCPATSNEEAMLHQNASIYGSLRTNGSISPEHPYDGDVWANFEETQSGDQCQGVDCGVALIPHYHAWDIYCPGITRNEIVDKEETKILKVLGDLYTDKCWDEVNVKPDGKLVLETAAYPYFIKKLTLANSAAFDIVPNPNGGIVSLYVNEITGDTINGNQMLNSTARPYQFRMFYLGTRELTLNGTADMQVALIAPNAPVRILGTFNYFGALLARELRLTGNGDIHYDESLNGSGELVDASYRIRDLVQFYR